MSTKNIEKDPQLVRFGKHIFDLRTAKGLTQEQLAERGGFHRNYIGMVERAERSITLQNLIRLSDALGMSISEMFEGFKK